LATYGLIASVLYRKLNWNLIISLIFAMLMGRIFAGLAAFLLVLLFAAQLDPFIFVKTATITGLPGIGIQLFLIPTLMYGINRYTTINLD
ncbi:MAG TPA: ECF transporter S component, partial [Tissierellaceae bacterium]|nr:ECF transporter S component [Tissierellaceae bacterium]